MHYTIIIEYKIILIIIIIIIIILIPDDSPPSKLTTIISHSNQVHVYYAYAYDQACMTLYNITITEHACMHCVKAKVCNTLLAIPFSQRAVLGRSLEW